jgi:AcrR family transcriptional regulator
VTDAAGGGGLRERKKAQTRRAIQGHALRLFLAKGYEATTVEEIAAAAGVSHMTFFRYFPSKEAVVENDGYDPLIFELIRSRPAGEGAIDALHRALLAGLTAVHAEDRDALLARTRLILGTPALRARAWQNQYATERLFVDALDGRTDGRTGLEIRVLAAATLAALTTALSVWVEGDGADDLPALAGAALAALHPSR